MNPDDAPLFDPERLPLSLESREEDVLREFYELFLVQLAELQHAPMLTEPVRDWPSIRLLAHKLKSSSLAVGAVRLGELLAALEDACQSASAAHLETLLQQALRTAQQTGEAMRARLQTPPA